LVPTPREDRPQAKVPRSDACPGPLPRTPQKALFYPHRLGFGGTEAAQLMREWGKLARRGRFVTADLDAEGALGGVRTHTLVVSIEGDWMAPRSAVDHLVRKLRGAPLERVHLASDSADPRSLDHFRWAKFPDAVVDVVDRWIDPATQGVARPFDS
jgi:predicted alpha/beta hydrolase